MTASDPRFVGTFPRADAPLEPPLPEIAFVGRSNVGKSSLLNAVLGRRIARISATPGKTRMMNAYVVSGLSSVVGEDRKPTPDNAFYLLDLPGYGYARASKTDRAAFAHLLRHALTRARLRGVVWLLDIRHEPSADDRDMQDRLAAATTPVLAVLTKSDKLPSGRRAERARALTAVLALDEDQLLVTSARTALGIPDLRDAIATLAARA